MTPERKLDDTSNSGDAVKKWQNTVHPGKTGIIQADFFYFFFKFVLFSNAYISCSTLIPVLPHLTLSDVQTYSQLHLTGLDLLTRFLM